MGSSGGTHDEPTARLLRHPDARAWEWRGGPVALVKRLVITLVVATVSFLATAWLLPRMTVDGFVAGAVAVILMALFNAIVRPVVLALAAPVSLILVGGPRPRPPGRRVPSSSPSGRPGVHVDGFLDGARRRRSSTRSSTRS